MKRLNVVFTDLFINESKKKFGISKNIVRKVILNPDAQQILKIEDLELRLFVKKVGTNNFEYYLLVQTRLKDNVLYVELAFKLLQELVEESRTLEPLTLLQNLALKFGLTIRVGKQLNKFIFSEMIPAASDKPISIAEVINPNNHNFLKSLLFKVEEKNGVRMANVTLAYCIDVDNYLAWITQRPPMLKGDVIVKIAPQIRGHVTARDLINAVGTLTFLTNSSQFEKGGTLFEIVCAPYYNLKAGFTPDSFYIQRNDKKLDVPLEDYRATGDIFFYTSWQPTEMSVAILDSSFDEAISSSGNFEDEFERRKKTLKTPPTLPPNSLIEWARHQLVVPQKTYETESDFYQEVALALQSISDKVSEANMYNSFWDITYESGKIDSKKPKKETDIHGIIHGLLLDIATAKNLEIVPEYSIGAGRLDFLVSAPLKTGKIARVCLEFKHAHSSDIEHGLIVQLPEYMKDKGCDFGIYCVLFFKGEDFSEPKKYDDVKSVQVDLVRLRNSKGLHNIRILVFDFAKPKPPSKR